METWERMDGKTKRKVRGQKESGKKRRDKWRRAVSPSSLIAWPPAALQLIGFSPYYTHCKRLKYHSGRECVCAVLYMKGKQKEGSKLL